jgi:hypothetical protein
MRKKLILGFVVLNAILATAFFIPPLRAQIAMSFAFRNCCQEDGGEAFCCFNCCFLINDCRTTADCNLCSPLSRESESERDRSNHGGDAADRAIQPAARSEETQRTHGGYG